MGHRLQRYGVDSFDGGAARLAGKNQAQGENKRSKKETTLNKIQELNLRIKRIANKDPNKMHRLPKLCTAQNSSGIEGSWEVGV